MKYKNSQYLMRSHKIAHESCLYGIEQHVTNHVTGLVTQMLARALKDLGFLSATGSGNQERTFVRCRPTRVLTEPFSNALLLWD
jgi:hypothetical protein